MAGFDYDGAVERIQAVFAECSHADYAELRNELVDDLEKAGARCVYEHVFEAEREIRKGDRVEWLLRQQGKAYEEAKADRASMAMAQCLWYFAFEHAGVE